MRHSRKSGTVKRWSGLQARMTISYVGVTVVTVLLLELLVDVAYFVLLTRTPLIESVLLNTAKSTAQVCALEASEGAGKAGLNERSTFEPNQASSLVLPTGDSSQIGQSSSVPLMGDVLSARVSYLGTRVAPSQMEPFALLIAPDGRVLASSYPARYPISTPVAQLVPTQMQRILNALRGRAGSSVEHTAEERVAFAVQTVWSRDKRPIGALYVQIPLHVSDSSIFALVALKWIGSGFSWLLITVPIGGLFGIVVTRGLVRRIRRLGATATQFAAGSYEQRLPALEKDEVGQLEQSFNQMAQQLVESMAQRQVLIEQNVRQAERARIEQELRTAQHIQQSLLPKELPELAGWRFAPYYQPAREVGGDFYDVIACENGQLGIVIGDVTGKGVAAALMMATTCTMLRTAAQATSSPGEVLARVNELLCIRIPAGMFVTCFYAMLDPTSGEMCYANAGHDWPFHRCSDGVSELEASGMPLGMMAGTRYDEQRATLLPGESVLLYSDGLVEAHNPRRDMFGLPQLKAVIATHAGDTALVDTLLRALKSFTGDAWEQEDDVTLVLLEREAVAVESSGREKCRHGEHVLGTWTIPSTAGNEQLAITLLSDVLHSLDLPAERMACLESATAEAVMNAMEHGNHYHPDRQVVLQACTSETSIIVRVRDEGGYQPEAVPDTYREPDLAAKLAEHQTPRGWGLFLMHNLVDEVHTSGDDHSRVVELVMHLGIPESTNQHSVEQDIQHAREQISL